MSGNLSPVAAETARFVQVEITTVCNFGCFYCAGRAMPQRHMSMPMLARILMSIPAGRPDITVSLQGEGEPTLHPQFWDLVAAVHARGARPYTITNASRVDVARFDAQLPAAGVSLDTLDAAEAERIGRYNLPKVLGNLHSLLARMGPRRLVIHTVDYGQPLGELLAFVAGLGGVQHVLQPLQRKADYVRHYPSDGSVGTQAASVHGVSFPAPPRPRHCDYLARPRMRFFNIDGVELPCCFIKDVPADFSATVLRDSLAAGRVPATCRGCRELQ